MKEKAGRYQMMDFKAINSYGSARTVKSGLRTCSTKVSQGLL